MGEEEEEEETKEEKEDVLGDFFEEVAKAEKECVKEEDELEEEKREQTFVDDDGTTYDWSEEEKRYKPREMNEEGNGNVAAIEGFDARDDVLSRGRFKRESFASSFVWEKF